MGTTTTISCPYCNSDTLVILDGMDGELDLVSDCENCCRPFRSQSPAATVAAQANLRVVRHRFEGTSQSGSVGASHDEADVFDVGLLGKRAGCKALEKELASLREKVEGRPS